DRAAIGRLDAAERRRLGVAFLPEERLGHGAVPDASLVENMLLSQRHRVSDLGFVAWSDVRTDAEEVIRRFDVKTPGPEKAARGLSGGNLQKFVIGREIAANPGMFIACQPTWGVDAGAAAEIHKAIIRLAEGGTAVILISQDLDELFAVSTHLAVIARGHLGPVVRIEDATVEDIGRQMEGKPQVRAGEMATERAHV
ncbi:MAG TPA: ABC transporter ATP-binding protein, partial [Hyphomicrobiaceae bacterium]|nr:ABC transporter ATP-binding protein [Hyphomicrobiaceae bacterium]